MKVLVIGSNGQLGSEIKLLAGLYPYIYFEFTDKPELDITDKDQILFFFKDKTFDFCINCAAYTAVDKCESEKDLAYKINALGPENLAIVCKQNKVKLIHISTDFVFDGFKGVPLNEEDQPNPLSVYGCTKWEGEKIIQETMSDYFIIRTSWLYSNFGNNFVKTMLQLGKERKEIGVVNDQIGTPTNAADLAKIIIYLIKLNSNLFGLYHFSNEGVASWYDFAQAIFEYTEVEIELKPLMTSEYPLPAIRPFYSVLNKKKVKEVFQIEIPHWKKSLRKMLNIL